MRLGVTGWSVEVGDDDSISSVAREAREDGVVGVILDPNLDGTDRRTSWVDVAVAVIVDAVTEIDELRRCGAVNPVTGDASLGPHTAARRTGARRDPLVGLFVTVVVHVVAGLVGRLDERTAADQLTVDTFDGSPFAGARVGEPTPRAAAGVPLVGVAVAIVVHAITDLGSTR